MGFGTYVAVGNLAANQIIVIDANGNVRVLVEGELPKPGEVIVQGNPEFAEDQQLQVNLVGDNGENQDISAEIADIFAALEEGQDPTELGEDFATAAGGQSGSSLTASTSVARDGAETIASTNFDTSGFESLGLSQTQSLALLEQFRLFNPIFVDLNNDPLGDSLAVVTDEDTPISGTLTATDQNAQDILTFSQSSAPANGTAIVNPDGTWTYTPNENYNGPDSFTVIVNDGNGGTDTLVVNIDVTPVNDPATVGDDAGLVVEDSENQAIATGTLDIVDVDAGEAFVQAFESTNEYGTFKVEADGSWSFTINNESPAVQALPDGKEIPLSFDVTSLDGTGTGTVAVVVRGTNDKATIEVSDIEDLSVTEKGDLVAGDPNAGGKLAVNDVDAGEALFQVPSDLSGNYGKFTFDEQGNWTYVLDNTKADSLTENQQVQETLTVTSADGTATHTITVNVTGSNDFATVSSDRGVVKEDRAGKSTAEGDLVIADVDAGEQKVNAYQKETDYGTFSVDENGHWEFVINNNSEAVQALAKGDKERLEFEVISVDGTGKGTVTVIVRGTNDKATIEVSDIEDLSVTEKGDLVAGDPNAGGKLTVNDVDAGEALFQVPSDLSGNYGEFTFDEQGNWTYVLDNTKADSLTENQQVQETLTVTSADGTATHTITVNVTGSNDFATVSSDRGVVKEDRAGKSTAEGDLVIADVDAGEQKVNAYQKETDYGTFSVDENGHWEFVINNNSEAVQALAKGDKERLEFEVISVDGTGKGTVTVIVRGTNDGPVAENDIRAVNEDAELSVLSSQGVLKNDFDVDGDQLKVTAIRTGTEESLDGTTNGEVGSALDGVYGTLTLNTDGSYTYVANHADGLKLGQVVSDTFTYTVSDGQGGTDTATLTITVTGTNDTPIARNDSNAIGENTTLNVTELNGLLKNDSDIDGDKLEVIGIRTGAESATNSESGIVGSELAGSFGTLTVNADGSYKYVADNAESLKVGETVSETFTYTISDGQGGTDTATLTITVTGTNDGPKANDDKYGVETTTLLFSESFEHMANTGKWTVVSGDQLDDWNGTNGLEIQRDGLIAKATDGDYIAELDAHQNTAITTSINTAGQDSVRVEFDYNPRRDGDSSSDMKFTFGAETITVHADGTVSGSDISNVQIVGPDSDGWYKVTAEFDVQGDSTDLTFAGAGKSDSYGALLDNITVTGVNKPNLTTPEDTTIEITFAELLANDTDVDGDVLSIVEGSIVSPTHGQLEVDYENGVIKFKPDANYNGEATFKYTVTDGNGGYDDATVTLNVTPVNDPPVAKDDVHTLGNNLILNGSFESFTSSSSPSWGDRASSLDNWEFTANSGKLDLVEDGYKNVSTDGDRFIDMEGEGGRGDNVTLSQTVNGVEEGKPYQISLDVAARGENHTAKIQVVWNGVVIATITPDSNTMETHTFEVIGAAGDNTISFVEVGGAGDNSGTYLDNIKLQEVLVDLTTDEDTTLEIPHSQLLANDFDVDGDTLTITSVSMTDPSHGEVKLVNGKVVFEPADNFNGVTTFEYTISDNNGGTDTATVTVNVKPVNDAPVFEQDGEPLADNESINVVTKEDEAITGTVKATDVDGDKLTYTVEQPQNGSVAINAVTGEWKYTPNNEYDGEDSFVVTVADGNGGIDTVVVHVDVLPVAELTVKAGEPVKEADDAYLSFEIKLDELVSENVALNLTLGSANDTATKGIDYENNIYVKVGDNYQALTAQELADLVIQQGSSSIEVFVKVIDDRLLEGEETVTLTVSSNSEFVEDPRNDSDTAKIIDETEDVLKDTVIVGLTGPDSVVEGDKTGTFTITLSEPVPADSVITLKYTYTNASGEDIIEVLTVNVAENSDTATFDIQTVQDKEYEVGQEFNVSVVSVTQGGKDVFEKLDTSSANKDVAIDDSHDNPPKAEDFTAAVKSTGKTQVVFETADTPINTDPSDTSTDHISDAEDDDAGVDPKVVIVELPDHGQLFYKEGGEFFPVEEEHLLGGSNEKHFDANSIHYEPDADSEGFILGVKDAELSEAGASNEEFLNWGDATSDSNVRTLDLGNGHVVTITSNGDLFQHMGDPSANHVGYGIGVNNDKGIDKNDSISIDFGSRPATSVTLGLDGVGGWFHEGLDTNDETSVRIVVHYEGGPAEGVEYTFQKSTSGDSNLFHEITIPANGDLTSGTLIGASLPDGAIITSVELGTNGNGNWELRYLETEATDSFDYRAVDSDGNMSETKTVTVDESNGSLEANNDPQGFEVKLGEYSDDNSSPWTDEGVALSASFNGQDKAFAHDGIKIGVAGQVGGLGAQIEYDRDEQISEKFEINLDKPATQFTFSVSNLFENEGNDGGFTDNHEQGRWVAYLDGIAVASDTFVAEGKGKGTYEIIPKGPDGAPIAFDSVVFEATEYSNRPTHDNDASDYFLTGFKASSEGAYAVNQGGILTIPASQLAGINGSELLDNDVDSDGDSLRITYVYGETEGNAYIKDGVVYFDLTGDDFVGETTFKYQITDDNGEVASATVNVIVNPQPTASNVASVDLLADSVLEGDDLGFKVTLDSSALVETKLDVVFGANSDSADDSGAEKDLDLSQVRFTNGVTYDEQSGKLIVPVGVKDFSILIPTIDDSVDELDESYTVTVGGESATGSIVDNDDAPTIDSVTPNDIDVTEGDLAVFTVTLSNASSQETRFDWSLNSGSAKPGVDEDYTENVQFTNNVTLVNGQLVVPAGVTSFEVKVPTNDDSIDEPNEHFSITVGGKDGVANIIDNDESPITGNSHVSGEEQSSYKFTWSDFDVSDVDSANLSVVITSAPGAGDLYLYDADSNTWIHLDSDKIGSGYQITQEQIESGYLVFTPVSYESSTSMSDESNTATGNKQPDYAEFNYHGFDGVNSSTTVTMSVDIRPDTTPARLILETPVAELSEGFKLEQWDNLPFEGNNGNGVSPDTVEDKVESAGTPNSTATVQSPDFGTQHSPSITNVTSKLTGLVFLEAGKSYVFTGDVDDSFRLEIGGQTLVSQTWGDVPATGQGVYASDSFVPSASGWYTVTAFHDNESGPGNASINVKVDGSDAVEFNTENFDIVPDSSALDGKVNIGAVVEHVSQEGGYYPAFDINEGLEDTFINVSKITTQLVDTDGSETLNLVLDGLPEGTVVKLGDSELEVNSTGRVNISSWLSEGGKVETILDEIQIKVDEPGTYTVAVKAISDEIVGDSKEVTQGTFELIVHPIQYAPTVGTVHVNLSEETLDGGLEDDAGKGPQDDTTDVTSVSGSVSVSDLNGDDVSLTFEVPAETLYSAGTSVTWVLSDDKQTLEGYVGSERVISATINDQGEYGIELLAPINHSDNTGEDTESFTIPVIGSDGQRTGHGAISVTIEDDAPEAELIHHDVSAETKQGANVQLILDTSGSMGEPAGNGQTRLQVMQAAALQLLAQYAALGETRVQLIEFYSDSKYYVSNSSGSKWMTVGEASEFISKLKSGGGTDYDDATEMGADIWDDNSGDMIAGGSNISYFLSDGKPNTGEELSDDERLDWEKHLRDHDVTALAYGIGNNVPAQDLNPVSYDGHLANDTNAIIVPDVTQLPPVILQSVIQAVGGNLLVDSVGADGGVISEITIEGVTYSFDGKTLTTDGDNVDISHRFDSVSNTLSIYIDSKHSLVIDLDDGHYEFFGAQDSQVVNLEFGYTLTDSDGDNSSNSLSFEIPAITEGGNTGGTNALPTTANFSLSSDHSVVEVNFERHAEDVEDNQDDNKFTQVKLAELPDHGDLYYLDSTTNKYVKVTEDMITGDNPLLFNDDTKVYYVTDSDVVVSKSLTNSMMESANGTGPLNADGFTISGGNFNADSIQFSGEGSAGVSYRKGGIYVDTPSGSGSATGQETGKGEYISISSDKGHISSATIEFDSVQGHLGNGKAVVIAYLFSNGQKLSVEPIVHNFKTDGDTRIISSNVSFDEIRLAYVGPDEGQSNGFLISDISLELVGNVDVSDEFTYWAVDSDGQQSLTQGKVDVQVSTVLQDNGAGVDHVAFLNGYRQYSWAASAATLYEGASHTLIDYDESIGAVIDTGIAGDDVYMGAGSDTIYLGDSHSPGQDLNETAQTNAINSFVTKSIDQLTNTTEDGALTVSGSSNAWLDIAHGGGGNDHIYGEGGSDLIFGGTGHDILDGGTGNDAVRGGSGNDTIIGGQGNDILVGDDGADIFTWLDGDLDGSTDVIKDFGKTEGDKIDLSELFEGDDRTVDEIIGSNDIVVANSDNDAHAEIVVSKGGNSVTIELEGWNATQLTNELSKILIIKDD
ncbi:VCBS domain-containing protein [Vibrio sp. TRT 2004]|uniref:VCBS domain-containing protein n=1 Tax=Vibrio sp. TRT 2004 TaxID=3418506 RepID=UPI003CED104B